MARILIPIRRDLLALHSTIQTHQVRKQSVHVLDHARYMLHYHDQLLSFKKSIPRHRESICVMRDIFEGDNGNHGSTDHLHVATEGDERSTRTASVIRLVGIMEGEEARQENEAHDQGWMQEASRLRKSSQDNIMEEDEPENDHILSTASSNSNNITSPGLSTPFTYNPFLLHNTTSIFSSQPAFKLDIFESCSCTNTPRSSPPLETSYLNP